MGFAVRQFDCSAGADGAPPKPALAPTSVGIYIQGQKPMLVGDFWNVHKRGKHTHSMFCVQGNPRIICNGRPMVCVISMLSCGDIAIMGSPTVIAG